MGKVHRIDQRSKLTSVKKTDEGFLRITAPVARTGIYQYRNVDGSITREYVPEDTLFHEDSISSLQMKPVTNVHPKRFVDAANAKDTIVGTVGQTFMRDGDKLVTDFIVTHKDAIDSIQSGRDELSPGYDCELEYTSGVTPDGEKYDAIQRNRVYNHLAIVDAARGGRDITLRTDSEDGTAVEIKEDEKPKTGGNDMSDIILKVDGVDVKVDGPAAQKLLDAANSRADSAETQLDTEKSAHVSTKAKADAASEELETLKTERTDSDVITEAVTAKIRLVDSARAICGEEAIKVEHSDEEIMKTVILETSKTAKLDGASPEYIKARFDVAMEQHADGDDQQREEKVSSQRRDLQSNRTDSADKSTARQKRHDSQDNAWKKGDN